MAEVRRLNELIQTACNEFGPARQAAEAALLSAGAPAAARIIEELRGEGQSRGGYLGGLLGRMADPAVVPLLLAELDTEEVGLSLAVLRALGEIRDRRAVAPLCARLSQKGDPTVRQRVMVGVLGEIGDPAARPLLRRMARTILGGEYKPAAVHRLCSRAEKEFDFNPPELLLALAVALARLGDRRLGFVAPSVLEHRFGRKGRIDGYVLRSNAAEATRHALWPGISAVAQRALRDPNVEVRRHVLWTLYYLGLRQSIAALIGMTSSRDPEVKGNARVFLARLTGAEDSDDWGPRRWRGWWRKNQARFAPGVSYYLGRPLDIGALMERLADPLFFSGAIADLRQRTGQDFGYRPEQEHGPVVRRARAWWRANGRRFRAGACYLHGFRQPAG